MRPHLRKGSALPLVLWIIAVLMTIAFSFTALVHSRIDRTSRLLDRFQARLDAYSELQRGLRMILIGFPSRREFVTAQARPFGDGSRYWLDGTPVTSDPPRPAALIIQNESGLVNVRSYLNSELIAGLMAGAGSTDGEIRQFVDSWWDWVDADDTARPLGAERDYYLPLGLRPRNGPLQSVEEFLSLRGMTEPVFRRIRPFLVVGTLPGINPNTASPEVLSALPGMTEEAKARLLAFRQERPISDLEALRQACGLNFTLYARLFSFVNGSVYVLKASAPLGEGHAFMIECQLIKRFGPTTVRLTAEGEIVRDETSMNWLPFEVQTWREIVR